MPRQITVDDLASLLAAGQPVMLLDVRQPWENETAQLKDSMLVPLHELEERAPTEITPPVGTLVVAYCHHGIRSLTAAAILEEHGIDNVVSLAGGIDAWSRQIDPSIPRY
ncbi:MAG: hypothetical protein H7X95_12125 [Deltaproteobacteria bacterium]|nr:hypothetical protein [Deltaproteobacteria bacterium]